MTILWQRTGLVKMGDMAPAVQFARSSASDITEKNGQKIEVATPVAGTVSGVLWIARYESLAE